jgi:hypothetical protein
MAWGDKGKAAGCVPPTALLCEPSPQAIVRTTAIKKSPGVLPPGE